MPLSLIDKGLSHLCQASSSNSDVRRDAADALVKLGEGFAIPGLLEALKDSHSDENLAYVIEGIQYRHKYYNHEIFMEKETEQNFSGISITIQESPSIAVGIFTVIEP